MKTTSRTEKKYAFHYAPRCGAKTKGNHGEPCRCPAIRGKARCRVHGGAKGSGAPLNNINALKHGEATSQVKAFRKELKITILRSKNFIKKLI